MGLKIYQKDLKRFLSLKTELDNLKKQKSLIRRKVEQLSLRFDIENEKLVKLMTDGAKCTSGRLRGTIRVQESVPRISWRDKFIEYEGHSEYERLMGARELEQKSVFMVEGEIR